MEIDDRTLTLFLIDCMTQVFERNIRGAEKPLVPGTTQRGLKNENLRYLEMITGTARTSRVEILVYKEGAHGPIFGMSIVSRLETDALAKNHIIYTDVLRVLQNARMNGFKRTREKIVANKRFSLFDIPPYREPAPVMKGGVPGSLRYEETIDDTLEFFGGGEEIFFHPDVTGREKALVFRSQIQGCRL